MTTKGYKHTEEQKKKMSEIAKAKGFGKWMKGRHPSEENRKKRSETMKRIGFTPESRIKSGLAKRGNKHPNWKGGRNFRNGHLFIMVKEHPSADEYGYVAEHRLVAEKVLGRYLKTNEVVHHINRDKLDNRNCNLLVCEHGYHSSLHRRMERLGVFPQ